MRHIPSTILFVFCISLASGLYAQQLPVMSSYPVNDYLSNPAMAGIKGNHATLINRNQYHKSSNAPETFLATLDGSFNNAKFGYGFAAYRDVINILGRSGAYGTYTYRLSFLEKHFLTFGLSLGLEQNKILNSRVNSELPEELILSGQKSDNLSFTSNFGMVYQLGNVQLGFGGYRLFENNPVRIQPSNEMAYHYQFNRHFVNTLSYRMAVINKVLFAEPVIRIRYAKGMEPHADLTLMGYYKDKFWAGAGYRQAYGYDWVAGVNVSPRMKVSYAMGIAISAPHGLSKVTNELMLGYRFGKRKAGYDSDNDGVPDFMDKEPHSPGGCKVQEDGIALDADRDNIPDCKDLQPETPFGAAVDLNGVALDSDQDLVIDLYDQEPETPKGQKVDEQGVSLKEQSPAEIKKESLVREEPTETRKIQTDTEKDSDFDGVPDYRDKELHTPHGVHAGKKEIKDASECMVNADGVATDSDRDGIMDCVDEEIFSPAGSKVNEKGIALTGPDAVISERSQDTDGDGISDELDLEPNTPPGTVIDQWGRSPVKNPDPAINHRIQPEEIVDHSDKWNYYVIIGVFRYYNNLKNYQKYLLKTYNEPTHVFTGEQNYYYVWTRQVHTADEARKEMERLKSTKLKDYIVGNPWLWKEARQ